MVQGYVYMFSAQRRHQQSKKCGKYNTIIQTRNFFLFFPLPWLGAFFVMNFFYSKAIEAKWDLIL